MSSISKIRPNGTIGVVGAGISGLTYAYFVSKIRPDLNITIFDKSEKVGGWIQTTELFDDNSNEVVKLDKGPRSLRGVSDGTLVILDILKKLGHGDQIKVISSKSKGNRKYLLNSNYEIMPIPHDLKSHIKASKMGMFSGIGSKVITEPFRKIKKDSQDESIELFFKRRFGSTVITDRILSAIIHGIYAGDVSKLSIKIFSRLQSFEQQGSIILAMIKLLFKPKEEPKLTPSLQTYESKFGGDLLKLSQTLKGNPMVVFKDSLSMFPKVLADYLKTNGNIKFIMNSDISKITTDGTIVNNGESITFDHVRSTMDVKQLSKLIESKELIENFNKIQYVSIFMANIYTKQRIIPQDAVGFGFLAPKISHNKEFLLGTIFDSSIASYCTTLGSNDAQETPYDKMTMMFGGHYFDTIPSTRLSLKAVEQSLNKVFGIEGNLIFRDEANASSDTIKLNDKDILISYNLHKNCIPQYNVGYEDIKTKVLNELNGTKLSLGGMCFGNGVGVPDCVMNSLQDALK